MPYQSEAALEKQLIEKLVSMGYSFIKINNTVDLEFNFRKQLSLHNRTEFTEQEYKQIRTHLDGGSLFVRAKKLRDKYELVRPEGTKYIEFINMKEWCQNRFQVTHQITNKEGHYENRYDVTILINGLPLVQIELKRRGMELKEAFNQINRYRKDSFHVGLFNYIQLFVISNGVNTKYFSNNRELSNKQTFFWTDKDNNRYSKLEEFSENFLERCHLAKMITKYIVLNHTDSVLMVLRPYQFYAAESITRRVAETVKNGYIWHTTGSGKTLTSFKTAQLLSESDKVDKILFVVDRKDLDYQTTKEFNHFSEGSVEGTEDTKSLVRQLGGSEKLVITTIQKLTNAVKRDRHSSVMERVKNKRMVFIFDECHRSQFGDMHKLITGFFPHHQCFGFTGTPILAENANKGKTTRDLFDDCLHQYVIKDAIDDDNVLGFSVEYISTFKEKERVQDYDVEAIDTKEVLEHPDRIIRVVDHILTIHNRKTFHREFTAMLAVSSISTLIRYYDVIKSKDHNLKIATIFSFGVNEDPEEDRDESSRDKLEEFMQDYNTAFGCNFTTRTNGGNRGKRTSNDFNAYYVDVSKKVKEKKIDLLLVVNMFLTGFDAPWLNTLYVDKNLQYHGLIQAFSRTNRLKGEKKKHGNIVCYRSLKKQVDQAVLLYSNKDALDSVLKKTYEEYLNIFNGLLQKLKSEYPDTNSIDSLTGEEEKKAFIELFRNILRLKATLGTFSEFTVDDTEMTEQELEDYTSKYSDLYEEIRHHTEKEKVSILDDIDFEVELLRRDDINVDYILSLLRDLDPDDEGYEAAKDFIYKTLNQNPSLKSKKKLIEEFINRMVVSGNDDVEGNWEDFLKEEKHKALTELTAKEGLDREKIEHFLEEYEFTGRFDEELLEASFTDALTFLERRKKKKTLLIQLQVLIEKYSY